MVESAVSSRRKLKRPTPERLRRRALAYLERFSATAAHLRGVLARRALREADEFEMDRAAVEASIDDLVADIVRLGLVDDKLFAEARTRRLLRRGQAPRKVREALRQKGVDPALADAAFEQAREEMGDPELASAMAYARRRRFGPWRRSGPDIDGEEEAEAVAERRQKEMAAMARAGFGGRIAVAVIDAKDVAELEARLVADQPGFSS